ncbi:GSCOCG00007830001-RA-CDS [Cotesia congregata]|nr:GSCOCG00007830001-RA-CDS [Cotesia congregata]
MDILNNFSFEKSGFKAEKESSEEYGVDDLENDFTYHYAQLKNISDPLTSDSKIEAPDNLSDNENSYFELTSDTKNENSTLGDLSNSVDNELDDDDVIIEMEYFNSSKEIHSNKNPNYVDLEQYSPLNDKKKLPSIKNEPSKSSDVSGDIKILDVRSLSEQDNNWSQNEENTQEDVDLIEDNDCKIEFVRTNCVNAPFQTLRAGEPWTCGICFSEFGDISQMLKHMRTHKGDKLFECRTCFERFSNKRDLTNHMHNHVHEAYRCYICSLSFTKKFNYNNHMRLHTAEKEKQPYRCDICSIRFSERRHLTSHLRTHNDDKPFQCEICSLKFKWKYLLTRHRRIHPE